VNPSVKQTPDDTAARPCVIGRFVLVGCGLAVFLAMTVLYRRDYGLYRAILEAGGIKVERWPFVDTSLLLATWECMRQGVDVWVVNPCDLMQRVYSYSPLWAAFSGLPLDKADAPVIGWCLGLLFILSLALLPPVRGFWGWAAMLAATLSPATVLGVERGNLDTTMFAAAAAAAALAQARLAPRLSGYAAVVAGGLIKYYPLVLLVLALRERPRPFLAVAAATLVVLAAFWAGYHAGILESLAHIPGAPYTHGYFGAKNLPFEFGDIIAALAGAPPAVATAIGAVLFLLLLCASLLRCRRLLTEDGLPQALALLPVPERVFLIAGGVVIVACFFAGQNVVYREVFFLLAIPGLVETVRLAANRHALAAVLAAVIVILFQMWGTALPAALLYAAALAGAPPTAVGRLAGVLWVLRELAGWWTVTVLLAVLADFLRHCRLLQEVRPRRRDAAARPAD
jgi:hypothetical protein